MSRSYKKTPIIGYASSSSEKNDKKEWHRRMRRVESTNLKQIPLYTKYTSSRDPALEEYLNEVFGHCSCVLCDFYYGYHLGGYDHLTSLKNECSNPYVFSKDGKQYMGKEGIKHCVEFTIYLKGPNYDPLRAIRKLFGK